MRLSHVEQRDQIANLERSELFLSHNYVLSEFSSEQLSFM